MIHDVMALNDTNYYLLYRYGSGLGSLLLRMNRMNVNSFVEQARAEQQRQNSPPAAAPRGEEGESVCESSIITTVHS